VAVAPPTMAAADDALLRRRVDAVLRLPRDFERDLVRTRSAPVQLALNAEDGAAAGVTLTYARRVLEAYEAELGDATGAAGAAGGGTMLRVRTRGWYNPTLRYTDYMVPGILVQLVTLIGTLLTALNIVREKELGTLEQLNVTPVTRAQFITAKLVPLWSLALVTLALGLTVGRLAFAIPMRGSLVLVFASAAVYLLVTLGIGLLVLVYARSYLGKDEDWPRFFTVLLLFQGAMLGIILSDNVLLLVVFWELTSLTSFLLIGFWSERPESRAGARMALVMTGAGGLSMRSARGSQRDPGLGRVGRRIGGAVLRGVLGSILKRR